jgi:hypothetical protein
MAERERLAQQASSQIQRDQLKEEAVELLARYDAIQMEAAKLRPVLNKACTDYGRATNRWGFSPEHLRIELHHEKGDAA